jgi:starch phosphorylase
VERSRGWYDPRWHYQNEPEVRAVLDLVRSGHFDRGEPGVFAPILEALLDRGDPYMHLADFRAYAETQERVEALYRDPDAWARKAILNVAASGKFSSDRTVSEYAREIWGASPCPVT